jgi:hypothetical protein
MHWIWIGFLIAVGIAVLRLLVEIVCTLLDAIGS